MTSWALNHGIRIGVVVLATLVTLVLSRRLLPRAVALARRVESAQVLTELGAGEASRLTEREHEQRVNTLSHVLVRAVDVVVLVVAALLILDQTGFSITPLLAGAGIVGVALGFGAQSVVRDLLAGIFILFENQFTHGDVVNFAGLGGSTGLGGVVEEMSLRRTVLRDLDGVLHTVPNGQIQVASNLTRGWSRVNLDVEVAYEEDLARVRRVLDDVGEKLAQDDEWGPLIIEQPKVLRVDALGESGITVKVLATTKPMRQWEVAGALRERIKAAFDAEGIEIPYPHRVVLVRRETPADSAQAPDRDGPVDAG